MIFMQQRPKTREGLRFWREYYSPPPEMKRPRYRASGKGAKEIPQFSPASRQRDYFNRASAGDVHLIKENGNDKTT